MTVIPSRLLEIPFGYLRKVFGYRELDEMIADIKQHPSNEDLAALVHEKSKWASTVDLIKSELPALGLRVSERLATHLKLDRGQGTLFVERRFGKKTQPVSLRRQASSGFVRGSSSERPAETSRSKAGPADQSLLLLPSKRSATRSQQQASMREALQWPLHRSNTHNSSILLRSSSQPKPTHKLMPQSSIEAGLPEASHNASSLSSRYDVFVSTTTTKQGALLANGIRLRAKRPLDA